MNKKTIIIVLFLFALTKVICAQELMVKSFTLAQSDLTAQTQPRKDLNDKNSALVKVGIGLQGVMFEGNIVGNVQNKTGEYWVYMPQGSRMLQIKHQDFSPVMVSFSDYGIEKIESNRTYVLVLSKPANETEKKQALTIMYSPLSAIVLVDNKMVKGANGIAKTTLPLGQHTFVVACDGYESEEGTVKLKATAPSNLQITLSKEISRPIYSKNEYKDVPLNESSSQSEQPVSPNLQPIISNSDNQICIPVKDGINIEMVKVEAGTFMMGATAEMKNVWKDENPVHQVTLTQDYYMGKYEVTQPLWQTVMGRNPSYNKGDIFPVETVSWYDCQEFIRRLNSITGLRFRLPTEAEWEYAARGGKNSRGFQYSGSNNPSDVAWCDGNSGHKIHHVGTKSANELGLYDMSGSVWEWCQDVYSAYTSDSQTNPTGAESGTQRVYRGGSYLLDVGYSRSSCRNKSNPNGRGCSLGLRLVLSSVNQEQKESEMNILGAKIVSDTIRIKDSLWNGLIIRELSSGKFKDAGMQNGFLIQKINDVDVYTFDDFYMAFKKTVNDKDKVLIIKGLSPNGKKQYFAVLVSSEDYETIKPQP